MPNLTAINPANIGWRYQNSYLDLPEHFYTKCLPVPVQQPSIVILNLKFAQELGFDLSLTNTDDLAHLFSGSLIDKSLKPIALAYAGHQFGHFTVLGDGRAHLLGEHQLADGKCVDIQLKGSGITEYSRQGDGRAVLGPMLREYIVSEAMAALGIPTTRSLAVVKTGERVFRESALPGAVLTRVAASHLRVGTFELLAAQQDVAGIKALADYAISRHYPELVGAEHPYLRLLEAVMHRQIDLVIHWLRVGFIHGVMNTDNMAISGETIDYGPCAFMDHYHPDTVFSSIDKRGRYAYKNQPNIVLWNLTRFAETLLPLIDDDIDQAAAQAEETLRDFNTIFPQKWLTMMKAKLGLVLDIEGDADLIDGLLKLMETHRADYTNTFYELSLELNPPTEFFKLEDVQAWQSDLQKRRLIEHGGLEQVQLLMRTYNPAVIPRNHLIEKVLHAAQINEDLAPLKALLDILQSPYDTSQSAKQYQQPPTASEMVKETFCGT